MNDRYTNESVEEWLSRRVQEEKDKVEELREFVELVAKEGCVLPSHIRCCEKDGYSETLWCIPCRALTILEEVLELA